MVLSIAFPKRLNTSETIQYWTGCLDLVKTGWYHCWDYNCGIHLLHLLLALLYEEKRTPSTMQEQYGTIPSLNIKYPPEPRVGCWIGSLGGHVGQCLMLYCYRDDRTRSGNQTSKVSQQLGHPIAWIFFRHFVGMKTADQSNVWFVCLPGHFYQGWAKILISQNEKQRKPRWLLVKAILVQFCLWPVPHAGPHKGVNPQTVSILVGIHSSKLLCQWQAHL